MSESTITWSDDEGLATLSNGKQAPGDRFGLWKPDSVPIGPSATRLGSGRVDQFEFRRDNRVSFELAAIPSSELSKLRRLKYHLMCGGIVQLAGDRELIGEYEFCAIAPDIEPDYEMSDRENLEYTFTATLIASEVTDADFLPRFVPSLLLDLDGDVAAASFEDGASADYCYDVSGNDYHATQSNPAHRPLLRSNVLNGHAVLEFSSDDYLLTPDIKVPTDSPGATLFLVTRRLGSSVDGQSFLCFAQEINELLSMESAIIENPDAQFAWNTPESGSPIIGGDCSEWTILEMEFDNIDAAYTYVNGAVGGTIDPSDGMSSSARAKVRLGAGGQTTTSFGAHCQIARVLLYNGRINASNRIRLTAHMGTRYDISYV